MFDLSSFKELPNRETHDCFGCGPKNKQGLQMVFFSDGERVVSNLKVPAHLGGWNSLVHGGVISTMLDEIMSWGAIALLHKIILTKSLTVDFLKPVKIGEELQVVGIVDTVISEREALMKGEIYNSKNELLARSSGKFALFTFEAMQKMNLLDEQTVKDMEAIF